MSVAEAQTTSFSRSVGPVSAGASFLFLLLLTLPTLFFVFRASQSPEFTIDVSWNVLGGMALIAFLSGLFTSASPQDGSDGYYWVKAGLTMTFFAMGSLALPAISDALNGGASRNVCAGDGGVFANFAGLTEYNSLFRRAFEGAFPDRFLCSSLGLRMWFVVLLMPGAVILVLYNAMIADHRKAGGTRAYYESAQPVFYFGAIYFGMVILMYGAWRVEGPVRPWHAWQLIALGLLIQATALALGASLRGGTGGTGRSYDVVRANILSLYIFMSVVLYPAALTLAALIAPYLGKRPFAGFVLISLVIMVRFAVVAFRRPLSLRFFVEGLILGMMWMFLGWLTYYGIPLSQALSRGP